MSIISRIPQSLTILLLALLLVTAMQAQTPPAQPSPASKQDQNETFRVEVGLVNILFNVKDKHNGLISDLKKEDFTLMEDGKPQTIKYFAAESNLPLTLGILIDTSGSQLRVLPIEQEQGAAFLKEVLRDKDLAFLINFDIDVELDQDFTNSTRDLRSGLDKMKINMGGAMGGGPGIGQGPVAISHPKGTLLYDAIYLAADEKLKHEVGRKAIIILTDGEDMGSRLKIQDAIEAAQKSDVICYVLLIADRGVYNGFGEGNMRKLTGETGGRVIDVGNDQRKLQEAFDQIANELRSQYSLGYTSTNAVNDGKFRQIEIKTKAGKVQARKGYYATTK